MKTSDIGFSSLDRANDVVSVRSRRKNWSSSVPFIKTSVGKIKRKELREPFWVARSAGRRQATACAARLCERVKRCAQFTFTRQVLCRPLCCARCRCSQGASKGGGDAEQRRKKTTRDQAGIKSGITTYRIEEQVGYLLRRAHQRASSIFQVSIGDPNITPTQYSSMVKLHEYTELSQNHLGRLVGMDKATMQGVVRRLKERHLVDSRPHPGDARRTLLSLTTDGHRLITKLLVNGPAVSRETLKPLNNQEQRQLLELLPGSSESSSADLQARRLLLKAKMRTWRSALRLTRRCRVSSYVHERYGCLPSSTPP